MEEEKATEPAESTAARIGKFANAEELLAAYNALEGEFTRRCQLLKQLQAAQQPTDAQAHPAQDVDPADPAPTDPADTAGEKIEERPVPVPAEAGGADADYILAHAAECAEALSAVPAVMDACVALYKQKLMEERRGGSGLSGMPVIMPARRPRTLSEAKRLADELLNS